MSLILDTFLSSPTASSTQKVVIGVHNRNKNEEWVVTRSIAKLFRHEAFNNFNLKNDICLLKLNVMLTKFKDKNNKYLSLLIKLQVACCSR
jgi:hypothetical protein